MNPCRVCGTFLGSLSEAKKHFAREHGGEIETPEEYLNRVEYEQRDFAGEEPSTEGHNPQYETENKVPESYMSTLREYESDTDE